MSIHPYVVGQWVRGDKFYGRTGLIEEILLGNRNWLWLLGTRRIGKTSLLKQVEYLTASNPTYGYLPLFWDFQGAENPKELYEGFKDALLDAEERLEQLGISPSLIEEADDLFRAMSVLRRQARSKKRKLLLLCDEVEELIKLNQEDPSLLRKLRRAMQSSEDVRSVLASTIRLWALAEETAEDTSPFLHGFTPPLYIHALADDDALALIRQVNLPSASRPRIDDQSAEVIRSHCDNHPYLIQLVSKRFVELDDLEESIEQVAADPMVSYFFSVDFDMLSETEKLVIRTIAERDESTSASIQDDLPLDRDTLTGMLHGLEHLGFIRRNHERRFVLVNYFFKRWFKERPVGNGSGAQAGMSDERAYDLLSLGLTVTSKGVPKAATNLFGGRYELLAEAGHGATGVVYRAHDREMKVDVALKVLRPEIARNPEMLERFRKEIVLTRDLNHPNILPIYHLGELEGRKYLTMKWIDGGTLAEEIAERGPLEIGRILAITDKLASALQALHARGILHRDVKPHNVLLDRDDEPYLTDFGLVRLVGEAGMTRHGVFVGTPAYASPEQAKMRELDERSDIYSLGLVVFEMATGRRAFDARSAEEVLRMHCTVPPPQTGDLRPDLPNRLSGLIARCLEKSPGARYPTAEEVRLALGAVQGGGS